MQCRWCAPRETEIKHCEEEEREQAQRGNPKEARLERVVHVGVVRTRSRAEKIDTLLHNSGSAIDVEFITHADWDAAHLVDVRNAAFNRCLVLVASSALVVAA